jgi:hypothetical protein
VAIHTPVIKICLTFSIKHMTNALAKILHS